MSASRKKTDVVILALLDADNKILICKRPKGASMPGYWEFPGGKIKLNESPEDALIREINEELSIDIVHSCIAPLTFSTYDYKNESILILMYVCRVWNGNPVAIVAEEIKWVDIKNLRNFKMPEPNDSLVAMIIDYL